MSLKNKIVEYLKHEYPRIVHKGEIGRLAVLEWGYENENAGRRCRELENENRIERLLDEKGQARYRYVPLESEKPRQQAENRQKPLLEVKERSEINKVWSL